MTCTSSCGAKRRDARRLSKKGDNVTPTNAAGAVEVRGEGLTIAQIAAVARGARMRISDDPEVHERMNASLGFIGRALSDNRPIYGVTTLFGGMADRVAPRETAVELQNNLIWAHKAGAGGRLPTDDVRAAMLLRANALTRGVSGIRPELVRRFETFLNAGVTPHVRELGSIGASGDLTPLAYIAGAITGRDARYKVDFDGEELDALTALRRLGLEPMPLRAKEGLALINGTSVCTAIAANVIARVETQLSLTMAVHALFVQAFCASNQAYHPFVHQHKPHAGQIRAAREMLALLHGSRFIEDELDGRRRHRPGHLLQDRYSIRCLPQFLGPILDGFAQIAAQVEVEANSATDNPLIDVDEDAIYHCGNFLAQYIGVGMDQLRQYIGLTAKHLDVQIALLVSPEFSQGLPPSLVGNNGRAVNMGLKSLQITANSIMPMLTYLGAPLTDRFPTHAEQFNQNVNSQALGSANLARRSADLFEQYLGIALVFAVQAIDLRAHAIEGHYDPRAALSPATRPLYEAVRQVTGKAAHRDRPFIRDDDEQFLDEVVERIVADIAARGVIVQALEDGAFEGDEELVVSLEEEHA